MAETPPVPPPSAEDMSRDLAAVYTGGDALIGPAAAAIRRALHAEAALADAINAMHPLGPDNGGSLAVAIKSVMDEMGAAIIRREAAEARASELTALLARAMTRMRHDGLNPASELYRLVGAAIAPPSADPGPASA